MKKIDVTVMIDRWHKAGVIDDEQARHMRQDIQEVTSEVSGKRFITAVMLIGALSLSLGCLLVIASNWDSFGKTVQLALALLMPLVPISFAYYRSLQTPADVLGRAAGIVGLALVGGTLALIAQIYNLEPNFVSFFWTWFILTAPFIWLFKRMENVLFSVTLLGITLFTTTLDRWEDHHRYDELFVVVITCLGLLYALALYLGGTALRSSATWGLAARAVRLGSASLAIAILFITTFEFYARVLTGTSEWTERADMSWIPVSVLLNGLFIGFLVWVLYRAFQYQETRLGFNIVRVFGIYLLSKYITLFSTMLDTGLFLIVGGLLFITGAWQLEKRKATLMSFMQAEIGDHTKPDVSEYDAYR